MTENTTAPAPDLVTPESHVEALKEAARIAERDAWQNGLETVELTQQEVDALLEYSTTLPTGKTIGKRWKRRLFAGPKRGAWVLCEYVEDPDPAYVGIRSRLITVPTSFPDCTCNAGNDLPFPAQHATVCPRFSCGRTDIHTRPGSTGGDRG